MKKRFDCVQMKHKIQVELLKEHRGVSDEKFYQVQSNSISDNTKLTQFLQKVKAVRKSDKHLVQA